MFVSVDSTRMIVDAPLAASAPHTTRRSRRGRKTIVQLDLHIMKTPQQRIAATVWTNLDDEHRAATVEVLVRLMVKIADARSRESTSNTEEDPTDE